MNDLLNQSPQIKPLNGGHRLRTWKFDKDLSLSELFAKNGLKEDAIPQPLDILPKDFPVEAGGSVTTVARANFSEGNPIVETIETANQKLIISFKMAIKNPKTGEWFNASAAAGSFADADKIKAQALNNPDSLFAVTVSAWMGETSKGEPIKKYASRIEFGRKAEQILKQAGETISITNTNQPPQADEAKTEVETKM